MLRKEFNEQLKQLLYFLVFVTAVLGLTKLVNLVSGTEMELKEIFVAVYQVGLLIFAMVSGLSIFSSERNQGGLEYVLTLPMSRYRLLASKIIPRLGALTLLYLLYILFSGLTGARGFSGLLPGLPSGMLLYAVFSIFCLALSLSLTHENFVLLAMVSLFTALIHFFFLFGFLYTIIENGFHRHIYYQAPWAPMTGFITILLPLLVAFFSAFKKYDISGSRGFNTRFRKVFVPMMILGFVISSTLVYSISKPQYQRYYLTQDNSLIRYNHNKATIHAGETERTIQNGEGIIKFIHEDPNYFYSFSYMTKNRGITRIDKKTLQEESLYNNPDFYFTHSSILNHKNKLAFIESSSGFYGKEYLVVLDLKTRAIKRISLERLLPGGYIHPIIFGAGEIEGKRFWLLQSEKNLRYPLVRIWENEQADFLDLSYRGPGYYNGLLVSADKEGLVISKLTPQGMETVKKFPGTKRLKQPYFLPKNLDFENTSEIYFYKNNHLEGSDIEIFRLDLESLALTSLGKWKGSLRHIYPSNYYLVKYDRASKKNYMYTTEIAIIKEGKITTIKTFSLDDKMDDQFSLSTGIIVKNSKKAWTYNLSNFQEKTFKL